MASAAFVRKAGALARMMTTATAWVGASRYAVIVKNTYTPNIAHTTYADISADECDTVGYQAVQLTGQGFVNDDSVDCDDIDVTLSDTVNPIGRYVFILEGSAASPQAADIITGSWDGSNGGNNDVTINAAVAINAARVIDIT